MEIEQEQIITTNHKRRILVALFVSLVGSLFTLTLWVGVRANPQGNLNIANYMLAGGIIIQLFHVGTVLMSVKREEVAIILALRILEGITTDKGKKMDAERLARLTGALLGALSVNFHGIKQPRSKREKSGSRRVI